jgi:hypothetical protein
MPRYEVRTIPADPNCGSVDYWKNSADVHYIHDTVKDRPVFGSHTDKSEADDRCADLNTHP